MKISKEKSSKILEQKEIIDEKQNMTGTNKITRTDSKSKTREKEIIIAEKYIFGKRLGKGSFGQIFLGINKEDKKYYAIKFVNFIIRNLFIQKAYN